MFFQKILHFPAAMAGLAQAIRMDGLILLFEGSTVVEAGRCDAFGVGRHR